VLSEKYIIREFVAALNFGTFAEVEKAIANERLEMAHSEDPYMCQDNLSRMTKTERRKFTAQRMRVKKAYRAFLQNLQIFMFDENAVASFRKIEIKHLERIFRNIAMPENPRCGRIMNAIKNEMTVHSAVELHRSQ
jgi:hypothetical protein